MYEVSHIAASDKETFCNRILNCIVIAYAFLKLCASVSGNGIQVDDETSHEDTCSQKPDLEDERNNYDVLNVRTSLGI